MIPLVQKLQVWAADFFPHLGTQEGIQEVKAVVCAALGWSLLDLLKQVNVSLSKTQEAQIIPILQRRMKGEPLSKIVGSRGFWKSAFQVNAHTLDPRPETEGILEQALAFFKDGPPPQRILDLGTGSGCILISLLLEFPKAWGVGVDFSEQALDMARGNALRLGVDPRTAWVRGSWGGMLSLEPSFDLIVSNPPYIPTDIIPTLDAAVHRYDPHLALDGGADGLSCYHVLIPQVAKLLTHQGCVLLEIGDTQGKAVCGKLASYFQKVQLIKDLAGKDRIVLAYRPLHAK